MKGKVLIVDDEPNMREPLAEILRLEGYQVETAAGGEEALAWIAQMPFDVMFLDILMPGIDGLQVLRETVHLAPQTRIILLTAHGSMESAIEALRHGAHDYLLKPASPQDLIASLERAIVEVNEAEHKRRLLEQMEGTLNMLKSAEGIGTGQPLKPFVTTVEGEIKIDLERREIWKGETRVQLTPTEGRLMKTLLENRGRVLSHKELVLLVQGYAATDWEAPEILRPLVSRLRRKLATFEGGEDWITNVRGTGYLFEEKSTGKKAD